MNRPNWIKTYLVDALPCIAILLYILAICYEMAFFSAFDINALSYISLIEILLNITEPLLYFTLLSLIMIAELLLLNSFSSSGILPVPKSAKEKFNNFINNRLRIPKIVKIIIKILLISIYFIYIVIYYIAIFPERALETLMEEAHHNKLRTVLFVILLFFFFLISYFCYLYFRHWGLSNQNGMSNALNGLLSPLLIIALFLIVRVLFPKPETIIRAIQKTTLSKRVIFILLYYIFSIVVFYQSGFEYGNDLKENDSTIFYAQMTDGAVFDNTEYLYIDKLGNHVFLFEKSSNTSIVLHDENIMCLKIKNDDSRNTLIY